MLKRKLRLAWLVVSIASAVPLSAKVIRVDISSRTDVLNGRVFKPSDAYECLKGRVYFSMPIDNPHNQQIVDLAKAVNLKNGEVIFSADLLAIRPKDVRKGNGSMILEVPNRGKAGITSLVEGGSADLTDAGDGWLLRNGFTVVSLGWQWDAPGENTLRLYAPIAKENGRTITGLLRGDLMPSHAMATIPLGHLITGRIGGDEYPVAAPDDPRNVLTVRETRDGKREVVARSEWQFAQVVNDKLVPSDRHIHLNGDFKPGRIYEYVYAVRDPVVAGLGFAAIRDYAEYAKHASDAVTPASRIYGEGISQTGRFLRDFLYEGFNADEQGRRALDGVLAHVAGAGRGSFNYRFAQPSRDAQPTSSIDFPTDIFPFSDLPETDALTGAKGGLLDRAIADGVVPKIFFSNTSYEYWGRAAALTHTSTDGKRDVSLSETVRIYKLTGLQHFSGPFPPAKGSGDLEGQQPMSPLPVKYFWRAMIANMDAWVRSGIEPPSSSYPKLADGSLVSLQDYAFPAIPGVKRAHEASEGDRLDFGPHWQLGILSVQPPRVGAHFPALVPQVNGDGNEESGIRLPAVAVPLATYAAWNLRDPSIGAFDQRVAFEDSYLPFARSAAERSKRGDPRPSIAERYVNRDDYLARYSKVADALVKQRWILPEDRAALRQLADEEWAEATK